MFEGGTEVCRNRRAELWDWQLHEIRGAPSIQASKSKSFVVVCCTMSTPQEHSQGPVSSSRRHTVDIMANRRSGGKLFQVQDIAD